MKILFIGDIFGIAGIRAIKKNIKNIKIEHGIDFVIANAENTTACRGLSLHDYHKLLEYGIDLITMGNHTWFRNDVHDLLIKPNILRPFNIESTNEFVDLGIGTTKIKIKDKTVRITNLIGKSVHCRWIKCSNPFIELEKIIINDTQDIHIVDFHAESTSEKNAMLRNFNGKVTAIIGTHTHVPTNDAKIINHTAYITDVGMTGPCDGVIGANDQSIIDMFMEKNLTFKLSEADGKFQFCSVILTIDEQTNNATSIEPLIIYE